MKKLLLVVSVLMLLSPALYAQSADSQIFIQQSGQNLKLDINQIGQGNDIGDTDNQTPFVFNGLQQEIAIDQIGSNNQLYGEMYGDSILATLVFTGDSNTMNFNVNPLGLNAANSGQYIMNITGSNNDIDVTVGNLAVSDNAFFDWDIVGDYNTFTSVSNVDDYSSVLSVYGNYNNFDISASGFAGHSVDINHTGDYTNFNISQTSTLEVNTINLTTTTGGSAIVPSTICIHQSDSGATGC